MFKKGKRSNVFLKKDTANFLCREKTSDLFVGLYGLFESRVDVPRIKFGEGQSVETLINEEALLLAKYLRNEKREWQPRIGFIE